MKSLDAALARQIAERDTDLAEAVIEPPAAVAPILFAWPDALDERSERPVFPRAWPNALMPTDGVARTAQPIIQDGQRLAQIAADLAERLVNRDWSHLHRHSSVYATALLEMGCALKEFGA